MVSWLRQGIVIGHAHLVPGFTYTGPPPPESWMLKTGLPTWKGPK